MTDSWKIADIGEYIETLTDYTANGSFASLKENVKYYNSENYAALVRTTDLEKKVFKPERFTDQHGYEYLKKSSLFGGEIVIANVGSTGKVYLVPKYNFPLTLAPNMYLVKFNSDIDNLYGYYLMSSPYFQKRLKSRIASTTLAAINKTALKTIKVPVPSKTIQQKIVFILSEIDRSIQNSDKVMELTLLLRENLIKKIFHHDLIEEKWPTKPLSEVAEVQRGKFSIRPRNDPRYFGGDIPFIQTGDVVGCNGVIKKFSQTLNEDGLKVSRLFKRGTIVITIAANIGDTGVLSFDSCFPDSLVGIIPHEGLNNLYLEYFLRSRKAHLNSIATQSAQKNINLAKLNPLPVIVPDIGKQRQIAETLKALDNKVEKEKEYKAKLIKLKNGLMDDIFNQKVEVMG